MILDILFHVPDQTNVSLTLRVNQEADDSQTCRRDAIQTGLKAAQGGHNSSNWFYFTCLQGHLLRVSLPALRLKTSRGQIRVFFVYLWSHYWALHNKILETCDYPRFFVFAEQSFTQAFNCHIFPTVFFSSLDWCVLLVLLQQFQCRKCFLFSQEKKEIC